jgi:tetratricopeptide (TPR) repeat protein
MRFSFILLSPLAVLLADGDRAFDRMDYPAAVAYYDSALHHEPFNVDILWRLARSYVAMGEVAPQDEREELYRKALEYSDRCIVADSLRAEGHTWHAAALGNVSLFVGNREKVQIANAIKTELDIALALKPDDDTVFSILGSFYHALGSLSWIKHRLAEILYGSLPDGGFVEAERAFLRAIELGPTVLRHRYELGRLYFDWGRENDAKAMFRSALDLQDAAAGDTVARRKMFEVLGTE